MLEPPPFFFYENAAVGEIPAVEAAVRRPGLNTGTDHITGSQVYTCGLRQGDEKDKNLTFNLFTSVGEQGLALLL